MRLPRTIEDLLPCPNSGEILDNNYITPRLVHMHAEMEDSAQQIADLLAISLPALDELSEILEGVIKDTGSTEVAEDKGKLETYRSLLKGIDARQGSTALDEFTERIETAVNKMGGMACARCGGVVIDRTTGIAYCGREVPQAVLDANHQV